MAYVNMEEIGKRIQSRRKQLGYTQEQLAELMDVSIQMVSNLERGKKAVRIENLVNLSRILEVSTDFILTGEAAPADHGALAAAIAGLSERDRRMVELMVGYCAENE